jgi:hypothetical protein
VLDSLGATNLRNDEIIKNTNINNKIPITILTNTIKELLYSPKVTLFLGLVISTNSCDSPVGLHDI